MESSLNEIEVAKIKSTIPVIEENGAKIAARMYEQIFEKLPQVKGNFDAIDMEAQCGKVGKFLVMLANNIDSLGKVLGFIEKISSEDTVTGLEPKYHGHMARYLLGAIKENLPADGDPEVADAWTKAFKIIAGIMSDKLAGEAK